MTNFNQEVFKFKKQKTMYYGVIALVLLQFYSIISTGGIKTKDAANLFGAGQWIGLILIIIGTNIFASEFKNRTIIQLFYKNSKKSNIYLSKLFVIISYTIILLITSVLFSFMVSIGQINWFGIYSGDKRFIEQFGLNLSGAFLFSLFLISIIFLSASLFRNSAIAVGGDLAVTFFGANFSFALTTSAFGNILKWNPFNMLNVMGQLGNDSLSSITKLNTGILIVTTLVYTLIFLYLGYFYFKNRRI